MNEGGSDKPAATRRLVRWLGLWLLLYGAGILLYNASYDFTRTVLIHRFQVQPAAWILKHTTDLPIVAREESILTRGHALQVMRGCDGIEAWILMTSALVTFPMPWMRRWRSVAWGTVLIFGLNLLRIVSLFYVMMYWPAFMDLAHGLIWQSIMVLSACLFVLFQMNAPAARSQPEPLRP